MLIKNYLVFYHELLRIVFYLDFVAIRVEAGSRRSYHTLPGLASHFSFSMCSLGVEALACSALRVSWPLHRKLGIILYTMSEFASKYTLSLTFRPSIAS